MSEGQGVKGHSQLDSTQEEARVRKEGGKFARLSSSALYPPGSGLGGKRPMTGPRWTLTLNWTIELKGGRTLGPPQHLGFGL